MVSAIANLGEVTPIASPTNPPLSSTHSAEAERLNQQVLQLLNKGKYSEAIPLAKRVIAVSEKPLGQNHPGACHFFLSNYA